MLRISTLIVTLFLMVSGLFAQTESDSIELSSFRKGRSLVGLSGSISSSYITNANASNDNPQLGNLYNFNIRLGRFVANKNVLGLAFLAAALEAVGAEVKLLDFVVFPYTKSSFEVFKLLWRVYRCTRVYHH